MGYFGYIEEGQFKNGLLDGFGRRLATNNNRAIGWWKSSHLHGYCKRTDEEGDDLEGLYQEGDWWLNEAPKEKE